MACRGGGHLCVRRRTWYLGFACNARRLPTFFSSSR
jgi:hypothetical protein